MTNPQSTARIFGHPIHPMLISFPIAFFVATLACDIAYGTTGNVTWVSATVWLLGAGIIIALLAATAGLIDVLGEKRIRTLNSVWWHAGGNVIVVILEIINWALRHTQGVTAVLPTGLILSILVVGILLFTGWKGWDMVYHYRVGVSEE